MTYALTLPLGSSAPIEACRVGAYTIPTDRPEGDGTLTWDRTTLVVAHLNAGGEHGLGYTYGSRAVGAFIEDVLAPALRGRDALDVAGAWEAMRRALRNHGRPGIASMALAALDIALWDLKGRLLGLPLVRLLGRAREAVPAYGSGGFTTYSSDALRAQLGDWARDGFRFVKMKVGMRPDDDLARVCAARDAVGEAVELFVDANGAYGRAEALAFANAFADYGVAWFEEPVSSDDLDGLRLVAQRAPGGGGRIRLRRVLLRAHAECGRGARAPGRRDTLWRHHRLPSGRERVRGARRAAVGAHRAVAARAPRLRLRARGARRVLPRSRTHRAHAVRRRERADLRHARARPRAPWPRAHVAGGRRRGIFDMTERQERGASNEARRY